MRERGRCLHRRGARPNLEEAHEQVDAARLPNFIQILVSEHERVQLVREAFRSLERTGPPAASHRVHGKSTEKW